MISNMFNNQYGMGTDQGEQKAAQSEEKPNVNNLSRYANVCFTRWLWGFDEIMERKPVAHYQVQGQAQ